MNQLAAALLAAVLPQAGPTPSTMDSLLVSAEWLAARIDEPDLVILHVDRDRDDYLEGHIPGARFLSDRSLAEDRDGGVYELRPAADLISAFEEAGVRDGARVIVYGHPLMAGRTFFTLEYLGFDGRVSLLDGGLDHWRESGNAVTTERPRYERGSLTAHVDKDVVVDAEWVEGHTNDEAYALIDARPANQYGSGHIEGAGNLYYEEALTTGGVLHDAPTLRRLFADAGMSTGRRVVTYCAIGMRASFLYFVARYLGYEASMYDGSFHDWRTVRGNPVVRGNR